MAANLPQLTKTELDCFKSKLWRMTHLYKIKDKNNCLINFKFNNIQQMMYDDTLNQNPKRYIVIKYRQGGVSTFWLLYWLDETIWTPNTTTAILAHKWESLNHLWGIIELAYKYIPPIVKPVLGKESAKELYFNQIESKIFISLSIRSTAINNLHISELCFCNDEEVRATLGAISPKSNVTLESTGNGIANDGYAIYQDAKTKENEYVSRFIAWFLQPEYQLPLNGIEPASILNNLSPDEKRLQSTMLQDYHLQLSPEQILFRRNTSRALKQMFKQEYPEEEQDAFMVSGNHFFSIKKIYALLKELRQHRKTNQPHIVSDEYVAFEEPSRKYLFVAGADTSEGLSDYSVLKIINVTMRREAFVFRAKCTVRRFAQVCATWSRQYNNAELAIEMNNTGHAVIENCINIEKYSNLYHEKEQTRLIGDTNRQQEIKYGWRTTAASRTKMLHDLKYAIESDEDVNENDFRPEYIIFDENFLIEALTFINNSGKYEAEASKHDDAIIASAIATQLYLKNSSNNFYSLRGSNFGIFTGEETESAKQFSE